MKIRIDERLRSHIPALKPDEYRQLEENILAHGCQSPLIAWGDILLDGHNRYDICNRHGVQFRVETIDLPDFEAATAWIEENQLGRRNLTTDQFAYYIGKKYERLKRQGARTDLTSDQNDQKSDRELTSDIIADQHGISAPTVRRAAAYARDVDDIANTFGDDARAQLLSGEDQLTRKAVADISKFAADAKEHNIGFDGLNQAIALANNEDEPEKLVAKGEAEILELAGRIRAEKAKARRAENEALRRANPLPIVEGKYGTIVIDPPWPIEKIERDVRPNQVAFDYPIMSEQELAAFPVADMAADDCHLFCWTTQKSLPVAFRLLDAWGFRYVFTMVWHKPGGFQPIGLAQYNGEFVLYGRRGSPAFAETKAFPCVFCAERREHSRKPDEFYEMIKRVTFDGRIDVFSRELRDGFDQFGNETDRFRDAAAG
jgi:N6-adenosine-specific RNA methylase IME4